MLSVVEEIIRPRSLDGNLGNGFKSQFAVVNGVKLHFVEGGEGPVVVLIPGWPQTWYAWRKIMPELASNYRVIAVDLRGMGESNRPETGYDTLTLANDISALMAHVGASRYSVVGHDIGMWVAYPLAATHGGQIEKLVVSEAHIPGVTPPVPMLQPPDVNARLTQFMFNRLPELPEFLIAGREAAYIRWVIEHMAYWPDRVAIDEYARAYSVPGAIKAGCEYYRAIPVTIQQNTDFKKQKLKMPVLALGGSHGAGKDTIETMKLIAEDVKARMIEQCGHYTPEECPEEFLREVMSFLSG